VLPALLVWACRKMTSYTQSPSIHLRAEKLHGPWTMDHGPWTMDHDLGMETQHEHVETPRDAPAAFPSIHQSPMMLGDFDSPFASNANQKSALTGSTTGTSSRYTPMIRKKLANHITQSLAGFARKPAILRR
jgi:hypothetical protein